ncbi:HNH endonuclease [Streptomyces sp. NPDC058471]|uniref:HNH endonuclease n=1 Tax=Streptomyces sp. NPDC058471 TaxID=3346516 RepID=UPI003653D217
MRGRSGRPWRRLVAQAKRELPPICHLCGKLIDMSLHWNDEWAWTLDHIHPLAHGGAPEDLGNVAPAHRGCNLKKGAKINYTPPKLRQSRIW